mmetsp:Transcript_102602/g.257142  ORF Transcript_102602/g.257142 Transcript_102602/m.257142 type:complete len:219 (-) Transcript_102602:1589-2245(-)
MTAMNVARCISKPTFPSLHTTQTQAQMRSTEDVSSSSDGATFATREWNLGELAASCFRDAGAATAAGDVARLDTAGTTAVEAPAASLCRRSAVAGVLWRVLAAKEAAVVGTISGGTITAAGLPPHKDDDCSDKGTAAAWMSCSTEAWTALRVAACWPSSSVIRSEEAVEAFCIDRTMRLTPTMSERLASPRSLQIPSTSSSRSMAPSPSTSNVSKRSS